MDEFVQCEEYYLNYEDYDTYHIQPVLTDEDIVNLASLYDIPYSDLPF